MHPAARLPNFFLAGVPRAGTTSLYFYLGQHPEIYVSPVKEPAYFGAADLRRYGGELVRYAIRDRAALRPYLEGRAPSGPPPLVLDWDSYLDLFRAAGDARAVGEGTVGYFWLPGAARAIREAVPDARLIFVLRDPAERLFSQHLAALWHDPARTFRQRFAAAAPGLVEEGRFATNLQRFFDLFPRDRIRVYLYEDYQADPRAVLRDVFAFLGVARDYAVDLSRRHNETVTPRWPWLHHLRQRLLGSTPAAWMPGSARRAIGSLYRRAGAEAAMGAEDRRFVIDFYADEIRRTADLIGRDLSAWMQ